MINRKTFFSFRHYVQYAMVTKKEIWFLLQHYFDYVTIMKKILFLYFTGTFTVEISSYMILHLPTTLTMSLTFRKNSQTIYALEKTCVIEKTFFLTNVSVCINNIWLLCFVMKWMDLLLVTDGDKSHYVYIKDFNRFMFHKTKNKNKKYFCKSCSQCFISKNVLKKHKEVCLSIKYTICKIRKRSSWV